MKDNRDAVAVANKYGLKGSLRDAFLTYWVEGDRERLRVRLGKYPEIWQAYVDNEERLIELFCEAAMVEAERLAGKPDGMREKLESIMLRGLDLALHDDEGERASVTLELPKEWLRFAAWVARMEELRKQGRFEIADLPEEGSEEGRALMARMVVQALTSEIDAIRAMEGEHPYLKPPEPESDEEPPF